MGAYYSPAPELAERAKPIIAAHHPELWNTRVEFVWRSEASHVNNRTVLGKARKISGLQALLATHDDEVESSEGLEFFLIEIARDVWDLLDDRGQTALLDHELCHCFMDEDKDGNTVLRIQGHDLEEFSAIARRWGRGSRTSPGSSTRSGPSNSPSGLSIRPTPVTPRRHPTSIRRSTAPMSSTSRRVKPIASPLAKTRTKTRRTTKAAQRMTSPRPNTTP